MAETCKDGEDDEEDDEVSLVPFAAAGAGL